MKKIIVFIALLSASTAMAFEANSTDYRITSTAFDFGGQFVNASGYGVSISITDLMGFTNTSSTYVCFGYLCVSLQQISGEATVAFLLNLNISGQANDIAYVDTLTALGLYRPIELNKYFTCIEDAAIASTPTFGIVSSGEQMNYIELRNSTVNSYILRVSELQEGNKFLLPVTTGGCAGIGSQLPLPQLTPFVAIGGVSDAVQMVLSFPFTDIVGNFQRTGKLSVIFEKNDTNQIVVDVV